ncbi:MAG: pyridoxamine 5'-phosphate oxidase family protein [Actinobacteria bacterium]|nr:pyridoxamine 5'-phosphate oxidase family protein [Actinomycetota bacterium]
MTTTQSHQSGHEPERPVLVDLDEGTCWGLLETAGVGRLVWVDADGPVAVPVNVAVSDGAVVIRTAAYSAMAREVDDSRVALEVDDLDHESRTGWSVLVRGVARVLFEPPPADAPTAWPTGSKSATVRIRPTRVTGRRLAAPATARTTAGTQPS